MLVVPIVHEVYHQFIPGPSVQEALVGTTAQGQSPWIEGSEENVTLDFTGNAVGRQDVVNTAADEEDVEDGFRIPIGLSERNQSLLMATPEERARGVVGVLRCVVCPEPDSASGKTSSGTVNGRRRTRRPASFVSFAPTSLRARMRVSGTRRNPLQHAPSLARPRPRRSGG